MFNVILGLPWLLVVVRFIEPLPWPWSIKSLLAAVLLIASQYLLFCRLSSGSVFSPEFPRPIIIAFNVVFGATVLLAVFQIALDIISVPFALIGGTFPIVPVAVRYVMGISAFCLAAFGVSQAIRVPALKDVEIAVVRLPAAFDGYRILQLTDLHISRLFTKRWAEAVVSKANLLDADVIVMTGDLIDGDVEHRRLDVQPIAKLRARDGVWAIPGNHEYFFDYGEWMREYERLGMRTLLNRHVQVEREGGAIVIAGVTDHAAVHSGNAPPDLQSALRGAPEGAAIILLDHQPMGAQKAADAGVSIQLSGHTHGGMVIGLANLVARGNKWFRLRSLQAWKHEPVREQWDGSVAGLCFATGKARGAYTHHTAVNIAGTKTRF
jgi:predicted MPP superfamily phosphohydrolase